LKMAEKAGEREGKRYKVVLECVEVTGECPAYKPGSRVVIDTALIYREDEWPDSELEGRSIILPTDPGHANCYPFILEFAPFYRSLSVGVSPRELGLGKTDAEGYFTCHNCDVRFYYERGYRTHGNAKFRVVQEPVEKNYNDRWDDYLKRHKLPPYAPQSKS